MSIAFRCTGCQCRIHVSPRKAGSTVSCPRCATRVVVPADSEAATASRFEQRDVERSLRSLQPVAGGSFAEESFELPPPDDAGQAVVANVRPREVTLPRWTIYAVAFALPAVAAAGFVCGCLWAGLRGR